MTVRWSGVRRRKPRSSSSRSATGPKRSSRRERPARRRARPHAFAPCAGLRRRRRGRGSGRARPGSAPGRVGLAAPPGRRRCLLDRVLGGLVVRRMRNASPTRWPPTSRTRATKASGSPCSRAPRPGPARLLALISARRRACPPWPRRRRDASHPMKGVRRRFVRSGCWRTIVDSRDDPASALAGERLRPLKSGRPGASLSCHASLSAWSEPSARHCRRSRRRGRCDSRSLTGAQRDLMRRSREAGARPSPEGRQGRRGAATSRDCFLLQLNGGIGPATPVTAATGSGRR